MMPTTTTTRRRLLGAALVVTAAAAFAACGDDDDPPRDSPNEDAVTPDEDGEVDPGSVDGEFDDAVQVEITGTQYEDVTVPAGGWIEIVNSTGENHTFTADEDDAFNWEIGPDEGAFVPAPEESGEYPFHCENHDGMAATLVVE